MTPKLRYNAKQKPDLYMLYVMTRSVFLNVRRTT